MADDFEKIILAPLRELQHFWSSNKPLRIIKVEGLNHFNESFEKGGFTDQSFKKWPDRKAPKWLTGKKLERWQADNASRATLIGKSTQTEGPHLKDSNTAKILGSGVEFSNDKIYAQVHNDGLLSGRPPGFTMTQRQFIGPSAVLEDNITEKITREINKILNQ
jgi:phage gpG-like protein